MPQIKKLNFDAESLDLRAAQSEDAPDLVAFEMVAYSGGPLRVNGYPSPVVIDLSGVTIKGSAEDNKLPITLDHKDSQRVGHAESVRVNGNSIVLSGVTSAESPSRAEVLKSHRNGFRWQGSIEGHTKGREFVKRGRTVRVNGRTFEGPVIVARKFTLRAVSFVSAGGDEDNVVRLAASNGEGSMDPKYVAWLGDLGLTEEDSNDRLKAKFAAETAEDKKPATKVVENESNEDDLKATVRKIHAEEQEAARKRRIEELEKELAIEAACNGDRVLLAAALKEGWSLEKTQLEAYRKERESSTPAIHVYDKDNDVGGKVIEAALCKANHLDPEKCGYSEKEIDLADRYISSSYGLVALMHDCIKAAGMYAPAGVVDNEFIRTAYKANAKLNAAKDESRHLQADSGFSTISLTGILSNLANKALLSSYQNVDGVVRTISSTRSVNDFKQVSMYRLTGLGDLLTLGPDGEIKHTEPGEQTYTNQIDTYARMMAMTRQMQINDDLDAFLQIPRMFGRAAARTEEKLGWDAILTAIAGGTFFSAGNGNLVTGSPVFGNDGLTEAKKLFREATVTIAEGTTEFIMTQGRYLVVPPALEDLGMRHMSDRDLMVVDRDTAATASTVTSRKNPHVNAFQLLSSPYFGAAYTVGAGGDDAHWMVVADPMDVPFLEFAQLRGQSQPVFESAEADFNVLGIQWRIYRDFGWAVQDPHGAVYSDGVA